MASSSQSSSLSQQLHEKEQLFTNWGLDDDIQAPLVDSSSPAAQSAADLAPVEKEHRRRSKAFAEAARAATDKRAAEERAAEERARAAEREEAEKDGSDEDPEDIEDCDDADDDDVVEVIDLTETETHSRPRPPPHPPRRTVSTILEPAKASAPLRRTNSTPLPETSSARGRKRKTDAVDDLAKRAKTKMATTTATTTATKTTARTTTRTTAKSASTKSTKKRDATPPLVPERQRIFAGLSFYYLPDAALGARRLRITKARQHGAQWVRSLREATHVVVDKQLAWSEVAVVVRNEGGDETRPVVVNEEYPLDCIGFRCLLNPAQRRYRILGRQQARLGSDAQAVEHMVRPRQARG
ncbi:hypothetical protein SCUCBS95973_008557 [Sporothrix curviconia]|uniref:BRCT domain-containing protein n=1 Tax=Sporothrix curviconia TaxID=1260050 RepID=A0ABP0CP24_9PEZI